MRSGTESSPPTSTLLSRSAQLLTAAVIVVAVVSQLLLLRTFTLLRDDGTLFESTNDLTVLINAQRQASHLETALERLDENPDLIDTETRLGLLTQQMRVMLTSTPTDEPGRAALERSWDELQALSRARDTLAVTPTGEWGPTVAAAKELAASVERDMRSLYDDEERRNFESVDREVAAKSQSQATLVAVGAITAAAAAALTLSHRRRARASLRWAYQTLTEQVAEREHAEELRDATQDRFRSLVQNSSDMMLVLDAEHRVTYCSPAQERLLGPGTHLEGGLLRDIIHPEDVSAVRAVLLEANGRLGAPVAVEYRLPHVDGSWRQVESAVSDLLGVPTVAGLVLNTRDVTERSRLEERLRYQAFHDPLTGIPNRALFMDRLRTAVARGERRSRVLAVLLVDLDGFKLVNDSAGHEAGDELLADLAVRLVAGVRPFDTVARLGGDEFAVLIEDLRSLGDAVAVANHLLNCIRGRFTVDERETGISASIGLATNLDGGATAEELLRNADLAMYVAKRMGRDRFEVFEPWMHERAVERLALEGELRLGLERNEFVLHFQPIVDLFTGVTAGFEALVRWQHPTRGLLGPLAFIPVAEETGLIVPVGAWVLEQAVAQAKVWRELSARPVRMTVNVSSRQLDDHAFPDVVEALIDRFDVSRGTLCLEVTESGLVRSGGRGAEVLQRLRARGVSVAIDDFGTGYSALAYLRDMPVDALKLDRSFVDGFRVGGQSAVGEAVVALARALGLELIAEGIEDMDQLLALRDLDCPLGQGFLFSPALPAEDAQRCLLAPSRLVLPQVGSGAA